jgi:hypothetical protein
VSEYQSGDPRPPGPHSKLIQCGELRVVFDWRVDRYGHRIEREIIGQWQRVLESVEGSASEDWPPSPALQSLHIERRENGSVSLLVGKAGISHWSASVEPLESRLGFQFDIACRVQERPLHIGSAYLLNDTRATQIVDVAATPPHAVCELAARNGSTVLRVQPLEFPGDYPATVRWRYRITPHATTTYSPA